MTLLIHSILPALLLAAYGGLLAMWVQTYLRPDAYAERLALRFGWVTLVVYAGWMALLTFEQRQLPILTVGQVSAFLGLLIWADQMYVHQRIAQRLLVVLPICAVLILLVVTVAAGLKPEAVPEPMQKPWSAVHITVSLAGIAMLLGGGVYGAGALLLHRQLVGRKFGRLFSSLPPMEDMHKLRSFALYLAWLLITVSLGSSIVFMMVANEGMPTFFSHLHIMFALWIILSVVALSERLNWLGDRRQARLSVAISALIFLLLMTSVIEMFGGGRS